MSAAKPMLGIIAGEGRLPVQLADACRSEHRPCFVLCFEGQVNHEALRAAPHAVVRLGAIGEALAALKQAGVAELVLAGRVRRPSLATLKPDMTATRLLARLGKAFFSGDDALLRALMDFLQTEGFRVVAAHELLDALLAVEGAYSARTPGEDDRADIALGLRVARALGALDVGQAVIVERGYVLGVEAAEGTQALIARCGALKREAKGAGVLVKAKKPTQDVRADLPAIGAETVEALAAHGFAGVAVEAGGSLVLEREAVAKSADALGVFVAGVAHA